MKTLKTATAFCLAIIIAVTFASCGEVGDEVWADATYTENTTLGGGKTAVDVEVKVGENAVIFTILTDKTTLGDALSEHNLISGDDGEFGMYLKTVNGITADYDVDKSYWALLRGGEMLMTGIDATPIKNGEHYELVYTK